uniref:Uncharacterized protein n=1 Tax=Arundo donax TaxID=35708 RepID=A0A0A9HCH3_ARUDO
MFHPFIHYVYECDICVHISLKSMSSVYASRKFAAYLVLLCVCFL